MQFFTGGNVAQGLDEHPALVFIGLAVGRAGMVDPARRIAADLGVDDPLCIHVKVKGVVGIAGVVRMPTQRLVPGNDLANVLNDGFALGDIGQGKHAFSMHARATHLNAPGACGNGFFIRLLGHVKNLVW